MCRIDLKKIPSDMYKLLIKEQTNIKLEKGIAQYSLEQTIIKLLKEYVQPHLEKKK